jgi:hypothetical protein
MEIKGNLENALAEIDALRAKMSELTKRKDIHQIELDLLLQKLRELYDFLSSLQSVDEIKLLTRSLEEKSEKPSKKTEKTKTIGFLKDKEEELGTKPEPIKEVIPEVSVPPVETIEIKPEARTEKTDDSKKSVHEMLSGTAPKKHTHIASVLHTKPLLNIEDAIGLNDKFLFIRELFKSNSGHYKETIEILNKSADHTAALDYIEKNFTWDPENEVTVKFLDLVRRRHISNKNG